MVTIISFEVSPGAQPDEDMKHVTVLKERLPQATDTENIAVITIGSARLSAVCEGIGKIFTGRNSKPVELALNNYKSGHDIFELLRVKIAVYLAYKSGAETIFIVHNLDHSSPVPEIRWAEFQGVHKPFQFNPIYLYC